MRSPDYPGLIAPVTRYLDVMHQTAVIGMENVPTEGPGLIVANHPHFDDPLLICTTIYNAIQRPVTFGIKAEYLNGGGFNDKGLFGKAVQGFFEQGEQVPVYRNDPRGYEKFAKAIAPKIEAGGLVALHPEGTRSPDGRLYKFRGGAAGIALKHLVPVIPTALVYNHQFLWRNQAFVVYGQPIAPEEYQDLKPYEVSELFAERISSLSGQERSDSFIPEKPSRLKELLAKTALRR